MSAYAIQTFADHTEFADDVLRRDEPIEDDFDQQINYKPPLFDKFGYITQDQVYLRSPSCLNDRNAFKSLRKPANLKPCELRKTVVAIRNPNDPSSITYEPSHIIVNRCIEMNYQPRHKCVAAKDHVSVNRIRVHKFIGANWAQTCSFSIKEHDKCTFTCKKTTCENPSDKVDPGSCTCKSKSG
ncbi:hypothetical protein AC249_AIPGENE3384 [Exaiptasia diaphana]|nr:hypothetical protein AC249_AIPGENE3384 [Exaiptasia diaphana]